MTSKLPESVFLLTSHFTKGFRLFFVGENLPLHRRHPITLYNISIYIIPYIAFLSIYFR